MATINLDLPDMVLESYQQNLPAIMREVKQAFIIWEYMSGHISLKQSAEILEISYRNLLELLWNLDITVDALNDDELKKQCNNLLALLK